MLRGAPRHTAKARLGTGHPLQPLGLEYAEQVDKGDPPAVGVMGSESRVLQEELRPRVLMDPGPRHIPLLTEK